MQPFLFFLCSLLLPFASVCAFDPLHQVEEDQTAGALSSDDILNRNIALKRMNHYTHASSYRSGRFPFHAHDGDEKSAWILGRDQTEGNLRISWGLAVPIDQINVTEWQGAAIESLQVELYDGKQWEVLAPCLAEERGRFAFPPRVGSALRISIKTDGKPAGIAEVEVFNTTGARPLPQHGSAELVEAIAAGGAVALFEGSPYLYSRKGRVLIRPRYAETCLADAWAQPVLESIVEHLGGKIEMVGKQRVLVKMSGKKIVLEIGEDAKVIGLIAAMAEKIGLEFLHRGALVLVGQGLDVLDHDGIASEMEAILGRNPAFIGDTKKAEADAIITPTLSEEGTTYEWAGFRTTYSPDRNASAWYQYSETKVIRSWANASAMLSRYVKPPKKVTTKEQFEDYKRLIRAKPETNDIIDTCAFMECFHKDLFTEFSLYNRLGIEVINQTGPKHWPDTLHDDLIQWGATYALTYYLAKNHGVAAHQFGNEPDPYFNKSTDAQIARRLTLAADAVHCAIEDVNLYANRDLKAIFTAPVLASDFQGRSARIMLRHLHTRYDGSKSATPLFQLFNRHRYSGRPHQNVLEVQQAKQMMQEEAGKVLPQVFTELNYSTGRNWARPGMTFSNDTPYVFTSIASIWGLMMQEQGVHGIFVFKLDDPTAWVRNDVGRFSNTVTYSMFPEQDPGSAAKTIQQISYGTKNFEVCRLFGKGFHGSRPLLRTGIFCSDSEFHAWTAFDEDEGRYYIWSVQANDVESYELEFDLSRLELPAGALITAEKVSAARHGEVTRIINLPADGRIRIHQAPESAMLLTVHKRPLVREALDPHADAMVMQGGNSQRNFGGETRIEVGRDSTSDLNRLGFLTFELPEGERTVARAVLELQGQSQSSLAYDGGFMFRVYAANEGEWAERALTAENAPNVCRIVSAMSGIGLNLYPVGHVTAFHTPSALRVDVTRAVREARKNHRGALQFVLIRELHWPGEDTDGHFASLSSREAGEDMAPKLFIWE